MRTVTAGGSAGGGDLEQAVRSSQAGHSMRRVVTGFIFVYRRGNPGWYILNESMPDFRLGDVIDDFCVKCRRVTNHSIVSLMKGEAAKVRCRTCYSDHDYRHEQAPPSKKELLKQKELFAAVLSGVAPSLGPAYTAIDPEQIPPTVKKKKRA